MADVAIGQVQLAGGWMLLAHELLAGVRVFRLRDPRGEWDEGVHTYERGSARACVEHVDTGFGGLDESLDADALRARAALYERAALDLDGRGVCDGEG